MIAFIGVRSSWLMLARKLALGAVGLLGLLLRVLGPLHRQRQLDALPLDLLVPAFELRVGLGEPVVRRAQLVGHGVERRRQQAELVVAS